MSDLKYAIRTGNWFLNNQVKEVQGVNPFSLDIGRFPMNVDINDHSMVDGLLGSNWMTGMAVYALTMLHDLTGDQVWVDSAEAAGNYLRCLQLTMDTNPEAQGALVEYGHHAKFSCTRDSLSGAWGLLRLFRATDNAEYLNRAELFAKWHMDYVLLDGYPISWHYLGTGKPNDNTYYGFQGGCAIFYHDLYEITGNETYLEASVNIVNFFMDNFWDDETGIHILYNKETGVKGDVPGDEQRGYNEMHKFNDDFAAIGLMLLGVSTGDKPCLKWVDRYMQWCINGQNEDGGFGEVKLPVSSCVVALSLLNAGLLLDKPEYIKAAEKARDHMMLSYQQNPDDLFVDGAVLGLKHCLIPEEFNMTSLRVTDYAVYTMTLFGLLEDEQNGKEISEKMRMNPMFPGLRVKRPESCRVSEYC